MNYLAHLLLAEPTDDSRLGGLIGDFMRGHELVEFVPGVQDGILRHRRIDRLTDCHPVFRRSRRRLGTALGRFSGVVVDVAYDHFLAVSWDRWHGDSLGGFTRACYELLERRRAELPPRLQDALGWIVGEDWLTSYARRAHLARAFDGIARRVKRNNPLGEAFAAFEASYDDLAADFAEFFPALRAELEGSTNYRTTRTP